MMRVHASVLDAIGGTPLVRLDAVDGGVPVYGKIERNNPMGSVKDRIAREMIDAAAAEGRLGPGCPVIEPTSGNTGIGLAMVCAVRGHPLILTMPESMSAERQAVLRALGARLVLTRSEEGMSGAIAEADRLLTSTPGAFAPRQFENPANPGAHERTTGPEIHRATEGRVGTVVAGIGTGGTVTGVGRFLKRLRPAVRIIGVEPSASPFLSKGRAGPHAIQGIGAGFRPGVLDLGVLDAIETVSDEEAAETARDLARKRGVFCGISSGAAVAVAWRLADRRSTRGPIVVILPDGGDRYLSTGLWEVPGVPLARA
jgi:cysteine synthase A